VEGRAADGAHPERAADVVQDPVRAWLPRRLRRPHVPPLALITWLHLLLFSVDVGGGGERGNPSSELGPWRGKQVGRKGRNRGRGEMRCAVQSVEKLLARRGPRVLRAPCPIFWGYCDNTLSLCLGPAQSGV
jgi:hypothetical protein